ncbi:MAG TPA: RNA methyltransferase [Saprospiraceae bacterium]|nr:RNA methyltransferase [Saprospiraceae bacterium]
MLLIESTKNERFKELLRLATNNQARRSSGQFLTEGLKENLFALEAACNPHHIYISSNQRPEQLPDIIRSLPMTMIRGELFDKLVYRPQSNILGLYFTPDHTLETLSLIDRPLVLILEAVEKPGNLGAVLRTADAVGADAVILCDPLVDFYNPNVIRSSVGTVFTVPLAAAKSEEVLKWCQTHKLAVYAAALQNAITYTQADMNRGIAILFGTEAHGLSDFWIQNSEKIIRIPMLGQNDSLNVSNSVAVIAYEALRQRKIH